MAAAGEVVAVGRCGPGGVPDGLGGGKVVMSAVPVTVAATTSAATHSHSLGLGADKPLLCSDGSVRRFADRALCGSAAAITTADETADDGSTAEAPGAIRSAAVAMRV